MLQKNIKKRKCKFKNIKINKENMDIVQNLCYYFNEINYEKSGFLDPSVDITYIIHLDGNGRINNIKNQLNKFIPTKKVIILYNKGYKCKNNPNINNSSKDLIDCYLEIFKHSAKHNHNNILILEDDFIFSDDILSIDLHDLNLFILNKKEDKCVYLLGSLPFILIPYEKNHYLNILSLGTHSVIYTRKIREEIISQNQYEIVDWDKEILSKKRFCYYKTLCYQLFPETENSKEWFEYGHLTLLKFILKKLELDKKVEPGYSNCLLFSKYSLLIIILIIVVTISSKFIKFD